MCKPVLTPLQTRGGSTHTMASLQQQERYCYNTKSYDNTEIQDTST